LDPLDELKRDHSSILEQLYALDKQLGWLESSSPERIPQILSSLSRISERMWEDLALHIQREEGAFYPVLESRLGYEAEPVGVMRKEHRLLMEGLSAVRSEISQIRQNLESLKTWGLSAKLQELRAGLSDHVSREERVLFWLAELHLSEIDRRKVSFGLLQAEKPRGPRNLGVHIPDRRRLYARLGKKES
jgi:iron-sulfur cluster repair protein YtfE (RIC family)